MENLESRFDATHQLAQVEYDGSFTLINVFTDTAEKAHELAAMYSEVRKGLGFLPMVVINLK